jgi:small subunit ribosomal protein S3
MMSGAKGAKVMIGGRLNGAEIARTEHLTQGVMPLHTLRTKVDFARSTAFTTYGTVGIKVWIADAPEVSLNQQQWNNSGDPSRQPRRNSRPIQNRR